MSEKPIADQSGAKEQVTHSAGDLLKGQIERGVYDGTREREIFSRRLEEMCPEAVDVMFQVERLSDSQNKMNLISRFNEGRRLGKPYTKDSILLNDGSRLTMYWDNEGGVTLGLASSN